MKLSGLWDITIFPKNLVLKHKIGRQILYGSPSCYIWLSLNDLYQYPKYIAKFLDEAFEDKEVSLAMMSIVRIGKD